MRFYDIFNGDADGLCALHQLRLAEPREAVLVTGVKRDIALVSRVPVEPGDELTVLDVSLESNRAALLRALEAGARVRYFDHHFAGEVPHHPLLEAHIDTSAQTCTSLIVDRHLSGLYRTWAVAAAYGDNLAVQAHRLAAAAGLSDSDAMALKELGECLNYNAYGEEIADLHFDPADLYRRMQPYTDPLEFHSQSREVEILKRACAEDLQKAIALTIENIGTSAVVVFMPDAAWSRRIAGTFANALSRRHAGRTVALLVRSGAGYRVSLRAPEDGRVEMQAIARQFDTGSGRARSAGIQFLPENDVTRLMALLRDARAPDTNPR